jgi:hypothetical protein
VRRKTIKRAVGSVWVEGRNWRLADEVGYLQRRAALHDGRFVSVGPLALFSTESGDAWLLDPAERLATRLARDGEPEPVHIEETEANFVVAWTGHYRIDSTAFIYSDRISGRVFTILGYPIDRIAQLR